MYWGGANMAQFFSPNSPNSGRRWWDKFTHHPIWAAVIAGLIVAGILGIIHHFGTSSSTTGPLRTAPSEGSSFLGSPAAPSPSLGSPAALPPSKTPDSLIGRWSGTVLQYNTSQDYSAIVDLYSASIGSPTGTVSYPTLGCSGELRLISIDVSMVLVTEYLTNNPNNVCVSTATLSLQLDGKGAIIYRWLPNGPNSEPGSQGTLTRM